MGGSWSDFFFCGPDSNFSFFTGQKSGGPRQLRCVSGHPAHRTGVFEIGTGFQWCQHVLDYCENILGNICFTLLKPQTGKVCWRLARRQPAAEPWLQTSKKTQTQDKCSVSSVFMCWFTLLFFFFYKAGSLRLRRESLKVRDSLFLVSVVM